MLCRLRLEWRATASTLSRQSQASTWIRVSGSRYITSDHYGDAATKKNTLPNSALGTVTTNAAHRTSIEQLIHAIPERAAPKAGQAIDISSSTPVLSLLLTPSFAQHALDAELPLRIFTRIRAAAHSSTPLDTVTAVVDRLPSTDKGDEGGKEGLAYLLSYEQRGENAKDRAMVSRRQGQERAQDQPATLNFHIPRSTTALSEVAYTLQLPLAQTIFSTGHVSTMVRRQYDAGLVQVQKEEHLSSCSLRMPMRSHTSRTLHFPLIPLTPFRRITESMGNIVRKISHTSVGLVDSMNAEGEPASKELETAISTYFRQSEIPPQTVAVWALVKPPAHPTTDREAFKHFLNSNVDDVRKSWTARETHGMQWAFDNSIRFILKDCGARLCRVLSGGGGWGKKAGLLSLDPETSYAKIRRGEDSVDERDVHVDLDESHSAVLADSMKDQMNALGEVAKKGDLIMFFLAPSSLGQTPPNYQDRSLNSNQDLTALRPSSDVRSASIFGCIPSTIDDIPTLLSSSKSEAEPDAKIFHEPNLFGMLSEGGMALVIETINLSNTSHQETRISRTKLDVPFARFGIMRPKNAVKSDSMSRKFPFEKLKSTQKADVTRYVSRKRTFRKYEAPLLSDGKVRHHFPAGPSVSIGGPGSQPNRKYSSIALRTAESLNQSSKVRRLEESIAADRESDISPQPGSESNGRGFRLYKHKGPNTLKSDVLSPDRSVTRGKWLEGNNARHLLSVAGSSVAGSAFFLRKHASVGTSFAGQHTEKNAKHVKATTSSRPNPSAKLTQDEIPAHNCGKQSDIQQMPPVPQSVQTPSLPSRSSRSRCQIHQIRASYLRVRRVARMSPPSTPSHEMVRKTSAPSSRVHRYQLSLDAASQPPRRIQKNKRVAQAKERWQGKVKIDSAGAELWDMMAPESKQVVKKWSSGSLGVEERRDLLKNVKAFVKSGSRA